MARYRMRSSRSTVAQCIRQSGHRPGVGVPITIAGTIGYMLAGWPHMAQLPPLSVGFVSLVGLVLDGAGLELHDKLWCALGALAAAPKTGNCIRRFSDSGCATICRQHDLAGAVYGVPRMRSLSPRTSQLSRRLRKLIPSKLFLRCPGCTTRAGTERSVSPPTATRSSVTAAARVRPLAVSILTV